MNDRAKTSRSVYGAERGSNQITIRDYNERLILKLVRANTNLTKVEAAAATGLSANAVSVIFRALEKERLIIRGEPIRGRIGQPSVPVSLNPNAAYYFGLKVGRRSQDLVLINFLGEILAETSEAHAYPVPERAIAFAEKAAPRLLAQAGLTDDRVSGFGVAMPYELWSWTSEFGAPKREMEAWRGVDFRAALGEAIGREILLENDGNAACSAELMFGPHEQKQDFVYFFVGAFIGGGIVLNGGVFTGRTGNAAGFGPMRVPGGAPGRDRLVDHASLAVLERMIAAQGGDPFAIYRGPEAWTAHAGLVDEWLQLTSRGLTHATVSALAILDFDAVVIDGAFPEEIRARLVAMLEDELARADLQGVRMPSVSAGRWGAIARAVGAASLPLAADYGVNPNASLRSVANAAAPAR